MHLKLKSVSKTIHTHRLLSRAAYEQPMQLVQNEKREEYFFIDVVFLSKCFGMHLYSLPFAYA